MGGTKYKHFYGNQSEQFTFYKVPKQLFVDEDFHNVSAEAKLLYGILLDRMSLSSSNGWLDEDGKVYIIFTIKNKLVERGVPADEVAFIHDADSEAKKKELFSKVRSGQVRVLLGSTQKMGAGTNVQKNRCTQSIIS